MLPCWLLGDTLSVNSSYYMVGFGTAGKTSDIEQMNEIELNCEINLINFSSNLSTHISYINFTDS